MNIVPVSPVSARPNRPANVLLAVGFSALTIVGSSTGQINLAGLRSPISSSNFAPTPFQSVVLPPLVHPENAIASDQSTAALLTATHKASGLTWEQIARYFGVSRRAVHLWVSGGRMSASNEELLVHLVRAVDSVKHLPISARRQALLNTNSGLNLVDSERARRSSRETDINRSPRTGVVTDRG